MIPRVLLASLGLLLLICTAAISEDATPSAHAAGWGALLKNDFTSAREVFSMELTDDGHDPLSDLERLEGLSACARAGGDWTSVWDLARKQFLIASELPGSAGIFFLKRLQKLAAELGRSQALADAAQDALRSKRIDSGLRRHLHVLLRDWHLQRQEYDQARPHQERDGHVRLFARLIGPFRSTFRFQLEEILPPEQDPLRDTFADGSPFPVRTAFDQAADHDGGIAFEDRLVDTSRPAVSYALVLLRSEVDQNVILILPGRLPLLAWMNGLPVYSSQHYRHEYNQSERQIRVRLRGGLNHLLLKTVSGAHPSVVCLDEQGAPAKIAVEPLAAAGGSSAPCEPIRGMLFSESVPSPVPSSLSDLVVAEPCRSLWLSEALLDNRMVDRSRNLQDCLLNANPQSLHLLNTFAALRETESGFGIDAEGRLLKEAQDLYSRVLTIRDDDPIALTAIAAHARRNRQTDRALELLQRASAVSPSAPQPLRMLAALQQEREWFPLAQASWRAYAQLAPDGTMALASFLDSKGREDLARPLFDSLWQARQMTHWQRYRQALRRQDWVQADSLLDRYASHNPSAERLLRRRRTELANMMGDSARLVRLLTETARKEPENVEALIRLGELALVGNDREGAVTRFEEALERQRLLQREAPDLLRRIRALRGDAWELRDHDLDVRGMELSRITREQSPEADHAVALRLVVRRILSDGSSESLIHNAIKVFDRSAAARLGELQTPRDPDHLLFCRTIQPDGTESLPSSLENLQFDKATTMYGVGPGAVLDYAFRQTAEGGPTSQFKDVFQAQEYRTPVCRARYVLILPKTFLGHISIETTPEDLLPELQERQQDVVLTWDLHDVPGLPPERFLPQRENIPRQIRVEIPQQIPSTRQSLSWQPVHSSREVTAKADEIIADAPDDATRIRRIYAWIAAEIGDSGGARTARDAFAFRTGGPEARLRLARAMLEAVGIESAVALPNPALVDAMLPLERRRQYLDSFRERDLLFVDLPEDPDHWLRFFSPGRHYRPGDLGAGLAGAPALVADRGGLRLVRVAGAEVEMEREEQLTLSLQEDESALVAGTILLRGERAGRLRAGTADPQRGPLVLEQIAASLLPRIQLLSSDFDAPRTTDNPEAFVFRFRGSVSQFSRPEGDSLSFSPFLRSMRARDLLTPLPRQHPFELPRDHLSYERVSFRCPDGWAFRDLPQDIFWATDTALFWMDLTVEGNRLTASRMLLVPAQTLQPDEYPALHRFLSLIDSCDVLSAKLAPMPPTADGAPRTETISDGCARVIDLQPYHIRRLPQELRLPAPEKSP